MAGSGEDPSSDSMPKVLLCGPHRAGKTSILQVVFEKKSPHETLFLESTAKLDHHQINRNALMRFTMVDFPGNHVFEESDALLFSQTGVVVFVIDAQEEPYTEAIAQVKKIIEQSYKINPKISFDILIHKIDGDQFFSEEHKVEIRKDIETKLNEDFQDRIDAQINFHCTSIYDHTIFEAFSKIVQKLLGQTQTILEQLLDCLITNSRMERAYLFDAVSKIYIASDPHPVDLQSYELCSDMIDVVIDVSCIYGMAQDGNANYSGSDSKSSCVIHLNNGNLLYLREVDCCLALVCILREENFDRQHLLDYNIKIFKDALLDVFRLSDRSVASVVSTP